jgi:predicted Zn-dependent peptidase
MIVAYFGGIPSAKLPSKPDLTEPVQQSEKRASKKDPLAQQPAFAMGYHMPERNTPDYYAMGLLDQILLQGEDSLLSEELVNHRGYAATVAGGINLLLGNMFDYNGPMLWVVSLVHDNKTSPDQILAAADEIITRIQNEPVDQQTLDRALIKLRSNLYYNLGAFGGVGRVNLLACFALFDDDPGRINNIEDNFRKVTPQLLQRTARQYLARTNRTVLTVEPGGRSK